MPQIPVHETSVRAVVPQKDNGSLLICGLPGLRINNAGLTYFDPEYAEQTFAYLAASDVYLLVLLMEDFELPAEARTLIAKMASDCNILIKWIPVVDYGAPNGFAEDLWKAGREQRRDFLIDGHSIAVACLYGAGRSGMMAAAICAEMGIEAKQAVRFVRRYFDEAVGSREQERWVEAGTYLTRSS